MDLRCVATNDDNSELFYNCNLIFPDIINLLLLAAPTLLYVRCGRHNSPPASSVMDFIFRCSNGYHVSVDIVHPSLLRCSSFSSPRWYHLQSLSSDVVLVSPLYVGKPPQFCFLAPLCDMLYHHMDISIVVTSSFFNWDPVSGTVSIPYSIADRTNHLWTFPLLPHDA